MGLVHHMELMPTDDHDKPAEEVCTISIPSDVHVDAFIYMYTYEMDTFSLQ